jgi:orotidine-5'-phosphate decarboxylase
MTPKSALQNGANFLVIGRPITSLFNQSDAGQSKDLIDSKLNEIESQIN